MFEDVLCYDESGKLCISSVYRKQFNDRFLDHELKENYQKSCDIAINDLGFFLENQDYNNQDLKLIFQIILFSITSQNRDKIFEKFKYFSLDLLNEECPNFVKLFDKINLKNNLYLALHYPRDFEGNLINISPDIPVRVFNSILCDIIEVITKQINESPAKLTDIKEESLTKTFTDFMKPILGSLQTEIQQYSLNEISKLKLSQSCSQDRPALSPSLSSQISLNQVSKGSKMTHF